MSRILFRSISEQRVNRRQFVQRAESPLERPGAEKKACGGPVSVSATRR